MLVVTKGMTVTSILSITFDIGLLALGLSCHSRHGCLPDHLITCTVRSCTHVPRWRWSVRVCGTTRPARSVSFIRSDQPKATFFIIATHFHPQEFTCFYDGLFTTADSTRVVHTAKLAFAVGLSSRVGLPNSPLPRAGSESTSRLPSHGRHNVKNGPRSVDRC